MSRSSAALAYDDRPIAPPRRAQRDTAEIRLLGGQGSYTGAVQAQLPTLETRYRREAPAANLRLVPPEWQAYAPGPDASAERESRLRINNPSWLFLTALALLALVVFTGKALSRDNTRHRIASFPVATLSQTSSTASGQQESIIDTTTAPQSDPPPQPEVQVDSVDYTLIGAPSIDVARIESVLKQYGSPAAGKGEALYSLGVRYGIDPAFALAFFVHESGCGTKGVARFTKSLGNIRWTAGFDNYEGYRSYPTWEAGIEDWYKLITDLYINGWNLRTVDAIIPVYAPSADNNSPPAYIAAVKSMVDSWRHK